MEEQNKVIAMFLSNRGLMEKGLTKRQRRDLEHIYKIVSEMNALAAANAVSVKSVAERTREGRLGQSISLATFYNNGKLLYDFVEYMKPSIEPGILDELNACKKENVELREINAALIRRDVKFEEMQAEIDALRNELKLARGSREATAVVETKQQPSQTKVIPPSLRGAKS